MKPLFSVKSIVTAAVALVALAAASSAQARSDVYFSIGVQVPGVFVQPAPVYVQPYSYYIPAPDYYRRHDHGRRYDAPQWQNRGPYGDRYRYGISSIHDQRGSRHHWRQPRHYGHHGDLDRDGIVNHWDRDRDGDGIRNRFDRRPNNPYRN